LPVIGQVTSLMSCGSPHWAHLTNRWLTERPGGARLGIGRLVLSQAGWRGDTLASLSMEHGSVKIADGRQKGQR
jgi:hypothetical protein